MTKVQDLLPGIVYCSECGEELEPYEMEDQTNVEIELVVCAKCCYLLYKI
jgi:hypothetical protein